MPIFDNWNENTTLNEAVTQAIGAASICWETPEGAGVFDSTMASDIADELNEFIAHYWTRWAVTKDVEVAVNPQEPYLGLATTEELFRELIARFSMSYDRMAMDALENVARVAKLAEMLGGLSGPDKEYKTVNSY